MVKFLISRPIAVIMSFVAFLLLGLVSIGMLPVSLMPDIQIPQITVKIEQKETSVRDLENTIVGPMRQRLVQVSHLEDIVSTSRNGNGTINLKFKYGTDVDYAFIDANEKVDAVMRDMPRDVDRPAVIKASVSDLPVFYINISLKQQGGAQEFMELSALCESVIKKRLEQLEQVAMVDMTGQLNPEIYILPDKEMMLSLGVTNSIIQNAIDESNLTLGSLQVIDGQYQYNIRFSNSLNTVDDIKQLYLKVNGRMLQLKDIAEIGLRSQKQKGIFMENNKQALSLAVIKQSDARMEELKQEVDVLLQYFARQYPEVSFNMTRDQTSILSYAISNLKQSLLWGGILAFVILFFFLKDFRSPWIIGISIPISLVIALLFFHLLNLSINIISLSGLILGIGMMIDNSIIVIDNISQHKNKGLSLGQACIKGTNEVIRPLISSALTTCAVFLPLIFISGISGALFYDQALAVAIGLFVSFVVSVTLLPTLYHLFWVKRENRGELKKEYKWQKAIQILEVEESYGKGWRWVFARRKNMLIAFLLLIVIAVTFSYKLKKERFPSFNQNELVLKIDWNKDINVKENTSRVKEMLDFLQNISAVSNAYIGQQQFMMNGSFEISTNQSIVFITLQRYAEVSKVKGMVESYIKSLKSDAMVEFGSPETIFERLFDDKQAAFVVKLTSQKAKGVPPVDEAESYLETLRKDMPEVEIHTLGTETTVMLEVEHDLLALYEINYESLLSQLKSAFNQYRIGMLKSGSQFVPIVVSENKESVNGIIEELEIENTKGVKIPFRSLVKVRLSRQYKSIKGGKTGEYLPISFESVDDKEPGALMENVQKITSNNSDVHASFAGSLLSSRALIKEMIVVMLISLLLLYFILAAQFESLSQPFIVLLEVPIDIAGALFLLWIFGGSINLMAMIGIIVMSGVIINDSILKIDTINQLRKQGVGLLQAIELGGKRRLKPIIMTSLTTILALVPFLFGNDMGSELQKPLALTVIGGMMLGTLVSLYFIPLCYYYLHRKK